MDRPTPTRPRRWLRRLAVAAVVVAVACGVLTQVGTRVSTAVGAEGVGDGTFPVVELAGLGSRGAGFARLTAELESRGVVVLDFDPDRTGTQALTYEPEAGIDVPTLAVRTVAPAVRAALVRAGLDPRTQRVDVVAHSMGGLLMRYLVEHPVDDWATRVDDLVMVGTPNRGSRVVGWETQAGPFAALGDDMAPGSDFLEALGTREPSGQTYTTVGGDPWFLRWYPGGFDDQVPSRSPFLTGAANNTRPHLHGRLLPSDTVVDLVVRTLAAR
ncbi:MAG: hypothetical protein Q7T56_00305 [Nocardioidaceae bacterium]|nr:hypothetical protein [Nocardioidaceae bacterium]